MYFVEGSLINVADIRRCEGDNTRLFKGIAQYFDRAALKLSLSRTRGGPDAKPMPMLDQIVSHSHGALLH